ncbi:MAG: hypothetical protein EWM72_02776 [Nitrospira sp.]|nr:MAG: hypothetical protein EWM72_02776 [Nitrospira sp.]
MSLVSQLMISLVSTLAGAAGLGTPKEELNYSKNYTWASGVGADQADKQYRAQRTLAASATEDLDLSGVLTDALGDAFTLAKIKKVIIAAAAGNTNNVNVTRPAANGAPVFLAAGDGIGILPGGIFVWVAPGVAGIAITAGTADLLTVTNSGAGTSVTYDVIIEGTSA